MTRCFAPRARAIAYSATAVLPALVCAETSTDSPRSCRGQPRPCESFCLAFAGLAHTGLPCMPW